MNIVVKIALMVFLSTIFMLLAAYSTIFKARAVRCTVVYEIVAFFLIISDGKLILGIIEFVIFQIMAIFSAISSLYAYAAVEIKKKQEDGADENCTALVVLPIKRQDVEVTSETVNAISALCIGVLTVCVLALFVFRPALLFPYYGKNAVLFMFALTIIVYNFFIAGDESVRAAEDGSNIIDCAMVVACIMFIPFGIAQGITALVYSDADDKAREQTIIQNEPEIVKLRHINEAYDYERQVPDPTFITDDVYVEIGGSHYYYFPDGSSKIEKIEKNDANVFISEDVTDPYLEIEKYHYTNPRGEEVEGETVHSFYFNKEQIMTY